MKMQVWRVAARVREELVVMIVDVVDEHETFFNLIFSFFSAWFKRACDYPVLVRRNLEILTTSSFQIDLAQNFPGPRIQLF